MRRLSLAKSPYYHYLEEDGNFRRWVEALERGSITTLANYFRKIAPAARSALGTAPLYPILPYRRSSADAEDEHVTWEGVAR